MKRIFSAGQEYRRPAHKPFLFLIILLTAAITLSCSSERNKKAVLWSDRAEFAFYCEQFNAAQGQYKIEMQYYDFPAQQLLTAKKKPDIAAGSRMVNASTRVLFRPLNAFFKKNPSIRNAFYPRLLETGIIGRKQYLLPVSFNAPVVIFEQSKGEQLSSPFTIDFNEIKNLGKAYNIGSGGVYTRMGFSPAWDDNFLYIIAVLFNVSFREAAPLAWDAAALENAIRFADEWNRDANGGIQAVEDFSFKYFYTPPAKLAQNGRILFTYMDSDNFFTIAEDERNNLDFRWLGERNIIPLDEKSVYIGLVKKGKSPKAANAFLRWFFQTNTQHNLLEKSQEYRMYETSFGISGGFSALRPVTETVLPRFYPGLLGHMPPEDFLTPANILPANWTELKERVILHYLHDKVRQIDEEVSPLERRLADWMQHGDRGAGME